MTINGEGLWPAMVRRAGMEIDNKSYRCSGVVGVVGGGGRAAGLFAGRCVDRLERAAPEAPPPVRCRGRSVKHRPDETQPLSSHYHSTAKCRT